VTSHWVFGYGSLVWRPDFPYEERRAGWIEGWERRFWQASTDHRGTPEAPGRVVTLVASAQSRCHGIAYRISDDVRHEVFAHLDYREKGGYRRVSVDICTHSDGSRSTSLPGLVYLADHGNAHYLGDAPLADIARQIATSHGPSGSNREYLLKLADALRELEADDEHVFSLEALVRGSPLPVREQTRAGR
jgi:cation transport protein ChaC